MLSKNRKINVAYWIRIRQVVTIVQEDTMEQYKKNKEWNTKIKWTDTSEDIQRKTIGNMDVLLIQLNVIYNYICRTKISNT
mgnify:CR=1 FL=1